MSDERVYDYINKIIYLEKALGLVTTYKILEPFEFNSGDINSLQEAAKKVGKFVGLNGYIFIVMSNNMDRNTGGQIELDNQREVFIDISKEIIKSPEATLATISHEITHKYMQINNIKIDDYRKYENEILTDITSIFLGLGKLMLNGCYQKTTDYKHYSNKVETIERTLKVGYLESHEIAFVYSLMCKMRKIPEQIKISGLTYDSLQLIHSIPYRINRYINSDFHLPDYSEKIVFNLNEKLCI